MERLSVKGLALAFGVAWGICMLFAGWVSIFGWCGKFVEVMGSIYLGFTPTFLGSIVGAIWGFVDGAIGGIIFGCIYNSVVSKK